jgi:hypothetical protein
MADILMLDYAGPAPRSSRSSRGSLLRACWRFVWASIVFILVLAVVLVRTALLIGGTACLFAGAFLLTLGGRRDAIARLARWRERWSDLLRLWVADIMRPLRGLFRRRPPIAQPAAS